MPASIISASASRSASSSASTSAKSISSAASMSRFSVSPSILISSSATSTSSAASAGIGTEEANLRAALQLATLLTFKAMSLCFSSPCIIALRLPANGRFGELVSFNTDLASAIALHLATSSGSPLFGNFFTSRNESIAVPKLALRFFKFLNFFSEGERFLFSALIFCLSFFSFNSTFAAKFFFLFSGFLLATARSGFFLRCSSLLALTFCFFC